MQTVIDLDIPPHESVLVLNGILHTDTNVQVVVSNSVGAFSNNSPSFINDASVVLYKNGVLEDTLLIDGAFYYISQTIDGCESADRLEFQYFAPEPTITVSDPVICEGQSTTISVTSNPAVGTVSYIWNSDENVTSESITVSPTESGNGWVDLAWTYESDGETIETLCRYFYTITVIELDMPETDWPDNTVIFCDQENLTIVDLAAGQTATSVLS